MSIEAVTWVLGADTGSATRKLVLIGIANHAHKDGRNAWPSRTTVAEYANCDPKTVGRHVKALLRDGWLRRGDQRHVDHLPHYVRPIVYDVAMSEAQRLTWQAAAAAHEPIEETVETAAEETHDELGAAAQAAAPRGSLSPGADWDQGSPETPPRDTAVSHKPSLNQEPPHPPASGGSTSTGCPRHPDTPGQGCRRCGTTPRQVAARERREAEDRRRRADLEQRAAERARLAEARRPAKDVADLLADTRRSLATTTTARSTR